MKFKICFRRPRREPGCDTFFQGEIYLLIFIHLTPLEPVHGQRHCQTRKSLKKGAYDCVVLKSTIQWLQNVKSVKL